MTQKRPTNQAPAWLALGTNLGDRRQNLRRAVRGLAKQMTIDRLSPIYETEPWGLTEQPRFLNLCLAGRTDLAPKPLLEAIKALEKALGRQERVRWGPRRIDIDILFYDDLILQEPGLTLPHPRLAERAFVLAPLADIAPDHRHPQTGQTVAEMLAAVDQAGVRRLAEPLFADGG